MEGLYMPNNAKELQTLIVGTRRDITRTKDKIRGLQQTEQKQRRELQESYDEYLHSKNELENWDENNPYAPEFYQDIITEAEQGMEVLEDNLEDTAEELRAASEELQEDEEYLVALASVSERRVLTGST